MTENSNPIPQANQEGDAVQHVAAAHRKLSALRQQLDKHPDLEEAISSLEMALSILTTKTGGML
ncbi:MAG: hypothetical protein WAL85_02645 [Candidatus Korobacteraceae bacterium]